MNREDINNRDNKGVLDILDTEESVNGVFEIDEKFHNGYHLYVPFGIHCELHSAISTSIRMIRDSIAEKKKLIEELDKPHPAYEKLVGQLELDIKKLEEHIKVLQALNELEGDI